MTGAPAALRARERSHPREGWHPSHAITGGDDDSDGAEFTWCTRCEATEPPLRPGPYHPRGDSLAPCPAS